MHHHKTYMYINFQQNRINRSVITVHTNLFIKNCKFYKFATTNGNFFKKSTLSNMHHRKTYMYINFQQNRINRSVITVHTNVFRKNCKLYKFATTNSNFFKNRLFQTCIIVKRTCISIFSKIGLVDQSKTCIQIYLRKNCKLHKFATTILKKVYANL